MARAFLARILWLQGFPDQAVRTAEISIADARAANHANSLCYALSQAACPIAMLVGDLAATEHYVEMLVHRARRCALALWHAWSRCHQGMLVIKRGAVGAGLRLLRDGCDELGEARFAALRLISSQMAESLGCAGQIADGLTVIEEAIDRSEQTDERWCVAELLRIKGELVLSECGPDAAEAAEDHFRQALDWARRQGALSWELRAATSLARLWRDQNRTKAAREILAPVYDRFTEGFKTADLKAAKLLLHDLRASLRNKVKIGTLAVSVCLGFANMAEMLASF